MKDLQSDWHRLGYVSLLVVAALFLLLPNPVADPDFGWHVRAGEMIVQRGEIPQQDWFSFTLPHYEWINHEWLFDITLYAFWGTGGVNGVRLLHGLIAGLFVFFVFSRFFDRRTQPLVKASFMLIAALTISLNHYQRPQMITIIGFGLVLVLLKHIKEHNDAKPAWLLVPLLLCWANLHAGFPIAFVLLFCFLSIELLKRMLLSQGYEAQLAPFVTERNTISRYTWKRLAVFSGLAFPVTLLNPYGWRIYVEVLRTAPDPVAKYAITEWMPTTVNSFAGGIFYSLFLVTVVYLLLNSKRRDLTNIALILAFFCLGLTATRHVVFCILLCALELCSQAHLLRVKATPLPQKMVPALILPSLLIVVTTLSEVGVAIANNISTFPEQALAQLDGDEANYRMLHDFSWGGYLLLTNPDAKTFIDGRMAHWKKDGKSFLRQYLDIVELQDGWEDKLDDLKIDIVLIAPQQPIAKGLRLMPRQWRMVYEDDTAVMYKKAALMAHRLTPNASSDNFTGVSLPAGQALSTADGSTI